MIINKAHDFGFVHIPKCAGSTIRQQLRAQDDLKEKFYYSITLPGLGRINGNHVRLPVLEAYFPDDLEALRAVTSYAITREPMERFLSGVSQYLRARGDEPAELSENELQRVTAEIIQRLTADATKDDFDLTVFFPQVDYVFLNGERVVNHLYTMENIDQLFDAIETRHNLTLLRDKVWNPTVTYKIPQMSGGLKRLKDVAQRYLPMKAYVALRELGIRTLTTKGVPKLHDTLSSDAQVRAFVSEHYAQDAQLYREACKQQNNGP